MRGAGCNAIPPPCGEGAERSESGGGEHPAILFLVASRGHHADVGGTAPGSMTPLATSVDEEGVLIDNLKLVDRVVEEPLGGAHRDINQVVADVKAGLQDELDKLRMMGPAQLIESRAQRINAFGVFKESA